MKKECYKQCRYVKCKGTMTKWPVQKPTHRTTRKHVKHYDATDILKKKICFVNPYTKKFTRNTPNAKHSVDYIINYIKLI